MGERTLPTAWSPGSPPGQDRDPASWTGPFAAAWVDAAGRLHVARDRVGHRSLYWASLPGGRVGVARRVDELVAMGADAAVDEVALAAYLACAYVPGVRTLARGVHGVEPGQELVFDGLTPAARPFARWRPADGGASEDDLRGALRATLEAEVDRLMTVGPRGPDGGVAATLSGGIDSSLVVALARRRGPVHALSVSFGPEHRDELAWSGKVAAHTGATHEVVTVSAGDVVARFDSTVAAMAAPNGDPLTVPNTLLFEAAAARGHGVVLNGEGGDPCFGGPKNAPMLLAAVYGAPSAGGLARAYLRAHQRLADDLPAALARPAPLEPVDDLVAAWLRDPTWPALLDRLLVVNIAWKGAWHILPKVEHLAAAAGVVPGSPLFAAEVVDLSLRVPAHLKRRGSVEKHLLKEAVRDLLPRDVVERPKSGMMVPVEAWFHGPLRAWARERLVDGLGATGWFERAWLERLVTTGAGGLRPRNGIKIWQLLTLESWWRQLEGRRPA